MKRGLMFYTDVFRIKNDFFYRGWHKGKRVQKQVKDFRPTLFVPSNEVKGKYWTLDGKKLDTINPGSVAECTEFIEQYKGVANFDIYGNESWLYQFIADAHPEKEIAADSSQIRVGNIDIETGCEEGFPSVTDANEEVLLITIVDGTGHYHTWGVEPYTDKSGKNNLTYHECFSEEDLLKSFIVKWQELDLDIITGWNINNFDIPYLYRRITKLIGENMARKLSPWNRVHSNERNVGARTFYEYRIKGVAALDYMEMYKKFTYSNQESYSLNNISHVELGMKKLDYSEYGNIHELYKSDWQTFVDYNIHDVYLVKKLDDKLKLIDLATTLAYNAKVNYEDVFYQVRMWDSIIYNYLRGQNIAIPMKKFASKTKQNIGAYVKEPDVGMKKWVVSFDVTSMYPHLMMTYNISPETLVKYAPTADAEFAIASYLKNAPDKEHGLALAANGAYFTHEKQGFLPTLMKSMFEMRNTAKKEMLKLKIEDAKGNAEKIASLNAKQQAVKVSLNSAYGALSNAYCRWFQLELAEAVTVSGQLTIQWAEKKLNAYVNKILGTEDKKYVFYADTDSVYIELDDLVNAAFKGKEPSGRNATAFLDRVCEEKFQPFIEKMFDELGEQMNVYEQAIEMKREAIADKGIWIAKKKYILRVLNNEGEDLTDDPKLKMMGVETVRSSTPEVCRDALKDTIRLIFETDENTVIDHIDSFKQTFMGFSPEQIAFPRGCNGLSKWGDRQTIYSSGTPIHVRGSLLYNHHLKEKKLTKKYQMIGEGDKIKFIYLKVPNTIRENIISFPDVIPPEFKIHGEIDYELQFQKTFLAPLDTILKSVGWKTEHVNDLSSIFA